MSFNLDNKPVDKQHDTDAHFTEKKSLDNATQNNNPKVSLIRPNFLTINTEKCSSTPVGHKYTRKTSPIQQKIYATTGTNTETQTPLSIETK